MGDKANGEKAPNVPSAPVSTTPPAHSASPWHSRPYRLLLGLWFSANICFTMHEATAAWLMASLGTSPFVVALLQAFSSLPAFLLALPSGALSDLVDRRRVLIAAHSVISAVGVVLGIAVLADLVSPALLLAAAFAMGATLALRLPAYSALTQELLPREALPRAIVLNGASMNAARAVGPVIAGAIIAVGGPAVSFLTSGLAMIGVSAVLLKARRRRARASTLPSERFIGAMRVGLQFARQTPAMRAALICGTTYFVFGIALVALLPVVVRDRLGGGANTYTLLFGLFGGGAVVLAFTIHYLRQRLSRDGVIALAVALQVAAATAFALLDNLVVLALAMLASGFAWLAAASSISVTAQLSLPAWVRGRGLATVQMAFMGGATLGAVLWGQIATIWNLQVAFAAVAIGAALSFALFRRYPVSTIEEEDLTLSRYWAEPEVATPIEHDEGPVQVMVEYLIDPQNADAFVELLQESRRWRLRSGVVSWALFRDPANPGRYIEQWVEESWLELLRHRDRLTVAERELRDAKRAFHLGTEPPVMSYLVAEDLARRRAEHA